MDMIAWILFIVAAIAAVVFYLGQDAAKKRAEAAEAKLAEKISPSESIKTPIAVANGVGPVLVPNVPAPNASAIANLEKKIAGAQADVKRLEAALATSDAKLRDEQEKLETALAKAASSEGMIAQARSKATEAGHSAVLEAKKETEAVRSLLSAAEQRLATVAESEKRISELVSNAKRAEHEAAVGSERTKSLQIEIEELRHKLSKTEANASTAIVTAKAEAEKALSDSFATQLQEAKANFENDLQKRLSAERERFESEQRRLSLELEKARIDAANRVVPAPVVADNADYAAPVLPRPRPVATKSAEIASDPDTKPIVILADADPTALKTITSHLEAGGYCVHPVGSIADAIHTARTTSPAALALDGTNLPDGDCWKLLTTVKEDPELKEIPVLVFAPGKDKERAMDMGAAGCFPKPVDKAVLVATIKAAMVKRKQRARLAAATGGARRSVLLTQ